MILIGGRIFVIFLANRHVCAIIQGNIGKQLGALQKQEYYKS